MPSGASSLGIRETIWLKYRFPGSRRLCGHAAALLHMAPALPPAPALLTARGRVWMAPLSSSSQSPLLRSNGQVVTQPPLAAQEGGNAVLILGAPCLGPIAARKVKSGWVRV